MKEELMRQFRPQNFLSTLGLSVILLLLIAVILIFGLRLDLWGQVITLMIAVGLGIGLAVLSYFGLGFQPRGRR